MTSYLQDLTLRLAEGTARLSEQTRQRHAIWIADQQQGDGGFGGREGASDLYYTSFALRSLFLIGALHGPLAERSAAFLQNRLGARTSITDLVSLVYSAALLQLSAGVDVLEHAAGDWQEDVVARFERLRREDGGFAKAEEGAASSTYHTFLILVCLQLFEQPIRQPERIAAFLLSQRSEKGGFREIRAAKRAGTNPTAAAVGGLQILGGLDDRVRRDTIGFLAGMQTDEGGLRANTRIPIADLLSTFTGGWTLADLGGLNELDVALLDRYVRSLESPSGGFHGALWDQERDVEYAFYGLGSLALLARIHAAEEGMG